MAVTESYQGSSMDQNPNPKMLDMDEAEEETLSLCDLPMYSDAAESENFSQDYQSSSWSSSDQDFFEFFSEEWTTTTIPTSHDQIHNNSHIIFCGKLIPSKQPSSIDTNGAKFKEDFCVRGSADSRKFTFEKERTTIPTTKKLKTNVGKTPKRRGIFRWKSESFNKAKTIAGDSTKGPCMKSNKPKVVYVPRSSKSFSYSREKLNCGGGGSVVAAPVKCKWYLFLFGLARFPTSEMDLGDMRSRQHRRGPAALFRSNGGGEKVSGGGGRGLKGLWGLIRAVRWGGTHRANTVVKASYGCMPRV